MAYEIINVGDLPNDGTGDPVRVAFIKVNNNFAEFASFTDPVGPNGALQFKNIVVNGDTSTNTISGTANLTFSVATNALIIGGNILPQTANVMNIGSDTIPVGNIYVKSGGLRFGDVNVNTENNIVSFIGAGSNISGLSASSVSASVVNVANTLSYGTAPKVTINTFNISTSTNAPNQAIFDIPAASVQTIKFDIVSIVTGTQDRQSATITATKTSAGTAVSYTVHNTLFQGNVVTQYDVSSSYGNIELKVSPFINSTITHNISYQYTI